MTAGMWKYSQVVWAYLILDAATLVTAKVVEIPKKNPTFATQKDTIETPTYVKRPNVEILNNTNIENTPPPLGLFVAQPSNIQEVIEKNTFDPAYLNLEPRYARNFGMVAIPSEQRYRGVNPPSLSLFTKLDKKKTRTQNPSKDSLPEPTGSDQFLTPEFYKFKSEIEKETKRTHVRGLKMSPDASPSPTTIYGKPKGKFASRFNYRKPSNPIRQESFINPYIYEEPYSYEESPSPSYAKPVSYSQYSSIPSEPYYPTSSTGSGYYDPPSEYSYPSFPTIEPEPYYYPKTEPESRAKYFSDPVYNDYPPIPVHNDPPSSPFSSLQDYNHYPTTRNREFEGEKEEPEDGSIANDEDDFRPSDFVPEIPKKAHRNQNYETSEFRANPIESNVKYPRKPRKKTRTRAKDDFEIPVSANQEDDEDDFETPEAFQDDKDENLDNDDSLEDEPPKARLQSPSKKQVKRIQGRPAKAHKKRCVKKRKEMSVETEMSAGGFDEEPSKKMTCLVCENLDTGGTYETCSYASDPKKNSYYAGNEASYRKGGSKNPYKYRMRRQTVTIINSTSHPLKHIVRRSYNLDSIGSFTSDVEDFGEDFTEDETEDQQEDDDDDLEEYKPSPPAYANEDACTEVTKNGLTCMVCHNPETNGKYKQCSYASDPDKNNYEYAQSSSYGSNDVPYKDRYRRHPIGQNLTAYETSLKEHKVPPDWKQLRQIEQKKISAINDNFKKLVRMKKQSPDSETLPSIDNPSYEEQFLNLFPELAGGSAGEPIMGEHSLLKELNEKPSFSSSSEENIPGFSSKRKLGKYFGKLPKKSILDDDSEDTEMSKMMKEFKTKDRSACKKTTKDKMTCYLCDDKDGIKREECMYVVENEPTKVSYHETKQTKTPDQHEAKTTYKREIYKKAPTTFKYKYVPSYELRDQPAVGTIIRTISDTSPRKPNTYSKVQIQTEQTYTRKGLPSRFVRRIASAKNPPIYEQQADFSNRKEKIYRKARSKPKQEEESDSEDPEETGEYSESEIVPEADPSTPYGAFSEETLPVYSPELKISLPRYMLEKNEHEQAIDDFMSKM